jgi:hypothetical protein
MARVGCALLVVLSLGCAGANAAGSTAMAGTVLLAGGVGTANVASGGCFTDCPGGTICNSQTGLCDRVNEGACGNACGPGQVCDASDPVPQCVEDLRNQPVPAPTPTGTSP